MALALSRIHRHPIESLGFEGVFRILPYRKLAISVKRASATMDSPVKSLKLFKFSTDTYILLADVQADGSLLYWRQFQNPNLKGFPSTSFNTFGNSFRFLKSPAAYIFLVPEGAAPKGVPSIELRSEFVSLELASRIVVTEAVERSLATKIRSLSIRQLNLVKINSIVHATSQWNIAWLATGKRIATLISQYRSNFSIRAQFASSSEVLNLAVLKEQRRVAWAAGSAIAAGNLIAATIPVDLYKWLAWPASIVVFAVMYWLRPFSRL